jgi:predicted HTH transcriptional regulator
MGTGTRDIVDKCRAIGLKAPEFIQEEDFKVILWRKELVDEGVNEPINEPINLQKISDNQPVKTYSFMGEALNEPINELNEPIKSIVDLILNRPGINRFELVESSKKGFATVKRYLKILKDNNLVEYKGSKKTGGYYLTDEAKEKLR